MLIHLILVLVQLSSSQLIQKLDIGEINFQDQEKVVRILSTYKSIFLLGKFNKYPIFELNTKLNSWVTNCEFCEMENWDLSDPEIIIFPDNWQNSTLFISALVFNNSIKSIPSDAIKIEVFEYPYCPNQCSGNGKCVKTCECDSGYTGYKCNTPISELRDDEKQSGIIPRFSWKFFETRLEGYKSFIRGEFKQSEETALYVYLSSSSNSKHFPSMANSKDEVSYQNSKEMTVRYFAEQKYVLWSIFCAQSKDCVYSVEIDVKTKSTMKFFMFISALSTVLVIAIVLALYYIIKLVKNIKNKYFIFSDNERAITKTDMDFCFPKYLKTEREIDVQKCCICLSEFEDKMFLRTLGCIHSFHAACIDQWTVEHRLCPLCKKEIFFSDKRKYLL